jgi:hypothetical protein
MRSFRLAPPDCPNCGESLSRWAPSRETNDPGKISLDAKLTFGYHICMMVLFFAGRRLSLRAEIIIALGVFTLATVTSLLYRWHRGWNWQGASYGNIIRALLVLGLGGLFLFSATPLFPPNSPTLLPWYLAGAGIILFSILSSLNVVTATQEEFARCCTKKGVDRPLEAVSEPRTATKWKRVVRVVFFVVSLAVWLEWVAYFYYFGVTYSSGSPEPTMTQTAQLSNHGHVVYITAEQQWQVHLLQIGTMVGIPSIMVAAAILHFVLGVRIR